MSWTISLSNPEVPALVQLALRSRDRAGIHKVMARAVEGQVKDHFAKLESTNPNKQGWKRQHFWMEMRRQVHSTGNDAEGTVSMPKEVRLRLKGGDVVPRDKIWLALPNIELAYGKRPGEFDFLRFVPINDELAFLVDRRRTQVTTTRKGERRSREIKGGDIYFVLKKRVHHDADPSVLPSEASMIETAIRAGEAHVLRRSPTA